VKPDAARNSIAAGGSRHGLSDLIERARAVDMVELAQHHGAKLAKSSAEFVGPCPNCGGHDRFSIHPGKGVFNCRGCGRGGAGAIDLEMFLSAATFGQAVEILAGEGVPKAKTNGAAASQHERRQRNAGEVAERIRLARSVWSSRRPAHGTVVETYLRARGYTGIIPATIGLIPATEKYPFPAMISAYALPIECDGELLAPRSGQVQAVHITQLLPDGSDRRRQANAAGRDDNKRSLGSPSGTPIALSAIGDGLALVITEGIEDALAYRAAGYAAWACGAAPYMPSLPVPDYVCTAIIEAHPDDAGRRYAARLRDVLRARQVRNGERPIDIILREAVS
jgi:hypothetical protein